MAEVDKMFALVVNNADDKFLVALARKLSDKLADPNPNISLILKRLSDRLEANICDHTYQNNLLRCDKCGYDRSDHAPAS